MTGTLFIVAALSFLTVSGDAATRGSPGLVSATTAIFMMSPTAAAARSVRVTPIQLPTGGGELGPGF